MVLIWKNGLSHGFQMSFLLQGGTLRQSLLLSGEAGTVCSQEALGNTQYLCETRENVNKAKAYGISVACIWTKVVF